LHESHHLHAANRLACPQDLVRASPALHTTAQYRTSIVAVHSSCCCPAALARSASPMRSNQRGRTAPLAAGCHVVKYIRALPVR
jgi:hypothetical protein